MPSKLFLLYGCVLGCLLTACATMPESHRNRDEVIKIGYLDQEKVVRDVKFKEQSTGSLWSDTYQARLFANMYRASKVGDTVTVIVEESAKGTNSGTSKSKRKQDQSNSFEGGVGDIISKFAAILNPANVLKSKTDSKFDADGSTQRSGNLDAKLTCTITRVFENGNMEIMGEQHMKINNERQVLKVEGVIRPYDVKPDNTVLSSSIADAHISFSGFGMVADRQKPGWFIKALDWLWPF